MSKKKKTHSLSSKKYQRGRRRKPFKLKLKKETIYTFSSVSLFLLGGIIVLSFSQQGFLLDAIFTKLSSFLGWGIIFTPFFFLSGGLMLSRLKWEITKPNVFVGAFIMIASLIVLTRAGVLGRHAWETLSLLVTSTGSLLISLGFAFIGFVVTFNTSLEEILLFLSGVARFFQKILTRSKKSSIHKGFSFSRLNLGKPSADQKRFAEPNLLASKTTPSPAVVTPQAKTPQKEIELTSNLVTNLPSQNKVWEFPPLTLLEDNAGGKAQRGDVNKNADIIEKNLESFGISANVVEVNYGPAVTQYALEIALGTKLSKITALSNDLALALAAPTGQIRIEAPIPGRSLIGVEVPNHSPEFVSMKKMLTSDTIRRSKSKLAVSLGLNVAGKPIFAELDRMPHILIAGATGSGKSVCINAFIISILFRASPDEVKLIMVDPKRVELTQYDGIPHLLSPVITNPKEVIVALKWATGEMERRYKLFAEVGARNIKSYNELAGFSALPYVAVIIDELADIMLFSPNEVEDTICRLAQMARATGIHLVISTQRPSVDILTGLIKANVPARIAFNVSSQIDSRVIIDTVGAEKLLGRGDMLFIPPDQAKPTRIQGTFVSEIEISRTIDFLRKSGIAPIYTEEVTREDEASSLSSSSPKENNVDPMFKEALRVIVKFQKASASLLQRRLKIGYNRAARVLDQMEKRGLIGPADGAKAREIFTETITDYLGTETTPPPAS